MRASTRPTTQKVGDDSGDSSEEKEAGVGVGVEEWRTALGGLSEEVVGTERTVGRSGDSREDGWG